MRWAKLPPYFRKYLELPVTNAAINLWLEKDDTGVLVLQSKTGKNAAAAVPLLVALINKGKSVRWISSDDYVRMYKEQWDEDGREEYWRTLKYIDRAFDVLVLDGLGDEVNTDFEKKVLGSLIKGRTERGLTTVINTQYNQMELSLYGGRVGAYATEGTLVSFGR